MLRFCSQPLPTFPNTRFLRKTHFVAGLLQGLETPLDREQGTPWWHELHGDVANADMSTPAHLGLLRSSTLGQQNAPF